MLNRVRGPFNVTAPAIAAGVAAMADKAHHGSGRAHNENWLPWVTAEIDKLGLKVTPSVGNFVLMHFPTTPRQGAAAADEFLKSRGIILRARRRLRPARLPAHDHRHRRGQPRGRGGAGRVHGGGRS